MTSPARDEETPTARSPLLPLLACAATTAGLDALYTASRGDLGPPGYTLLVSGLAIGAAAVTALCAGRLPVPLALASWSAFTGLATFSRTPMHAAAVAAIAFAAALWTTRREAARDRSTQNGVALGGALFLALVVVPDLAARDAFPGVAGVAPWLASGAALALLLPGLGLASRSDLRVASLAAPTLASVALSLGVVALGHAIAAAQAPPARFPSAPTATGPNVLVLVLDTVRADHLSLYGYERDTTPELRRRLADTARIYERAYSPSNWTLPAHVSLFTGQMPSDHQVHFANGIGRDFEGWSVTLDETLAQRLAAHGYRTACVTANPYLLLLDGAGAGFDVWRTARAPAPLHGVGELLRALALPRTHAEQAVPIPSAASVNRSVSRLLDDCQGGGCFLVANYMEAHSPYLPGPGFAGAFGPPHAPIQVSLDDSPQRAARAAQAYDEEILELDSQLAKLLDELAERGLLDDLWLFITSDHGESFGEHASVRHATNIYDDQVRIPLIVRPPRGESLPDASPVSLLDVTATVSAIATGEPLGVGRDLREAGSDRGRAARIEFFGWLGAGEKLGAFAGLPSRAVVVGDDKLLELGGRRELYDLANDPGERSDRARIEPALVDRLARELPRLEVQNSRIRLERDGPSLETVDALRALGYVE